MNENKRKESVFKNFDVDFEKVLNAGGNATIYEAVDKKSKQHYALKFLRNCSKEKIKRFQKEIRTIRYINSFDAVGIVELIDYSEDDLWYIMPILTPSLSYLRNHVLSIEKVITLFLSLVNTLAKLHNRGISHRDIKPDNIYIENNIMVLGDFGLVKISDSSQNITRTNYPLGAIFTMAPEMKREPKTSDGKKADVYSMAKTLWIFLTDTPKGFEGQYNILDPMHGLRFIGKYRGIHLVEIEELIFKATNNDPNKRPDIKEFQKCLNKWIATFNNRELSQKSDWLFLVRLLFGRYSPQSAVFDTFDDIFTVLKTISMSPTFNHVFLAGGGGVDFIDIQRAPEEGCFYFIAEMEEIFVVKPRKLFYQSFADVRWNYFLLEMEELKPAVYKDCTARREHVVEDQPGHYVSAEDEMYGVYEYDSGEKLPKNYKLVDRCLHDRFLITMKIGPYNNLPSTYDGRHADCSPNTFALYIETLSHYFEKLKIVGCSEEEALAHLEKTKNPFATKDTPKDLTITSVQPVSPLEYIKNEYLKWNFKECMANYNNHEGSFRFYFVLKYNQMSYSFVDIPLIDFDLLSESSTELLFVMNNGTIKKCISNKETISGSNCYYLTNRNEAVILRDQLNHKLLEICPKYQMKCVDYSVGFELLPFRVAKPLHLFTKEELRRKLLEADDRKSNRIVVDEDGYILIVPGKNDHRLYPVSHEAYMPRNKYVGKYSSLDHLDDTYHRLLDAWLRHLKNNKHVFCTDFLSSFNETTTLNEIKKYYQ